MSSWFILHFILGDSFSLFPGACLLTRLSGQLGLGTQLYLNLDKSLSLNEKECITLNVIMYWLLAVCRRPVFMPAPMQLTEEGITCFPVLTT